ncbi:MAG TPA: DUF692 domain-containing protein [Luteibacter sp.]|uniref:MNIO family bufferin maturase n=1 Tax=Luteibacter sp. TaxID=1886636 RepID=UPI002C625F59|nr:DUF692 domain-containing protein [Luteibacter sp.]HVI54501.1 DUF692 domain-containing protein [Luteibacter sp.]
MSMTPAAGIGFKPPHFDAAMRSRASGLWFEVHPENYMVDGGPRLAMLDALAERFPLSLHGVSLSLAAADLPDATQLRRLRVLIDRIRPVLVSEHMAWSAWGGRYIPDLLPFPRTHEALEHLVRNVTHTQERLGRRISLENPSHYLRLEGHDWSETDFLAELARRSGCGLLLDINNVYVSAHNLGHDPLDYLDAFPLPAVTEIHLAGHAADDNDATLLIDSHDSAVADSVWSLYDHVLLRGGARPTLIERDGDVPSFATLLTERDRAHALLDVERVAA